ncbi:DNA polymerase lambda [Mycena belliarum]|uniref:DNA polymerase lambda n=1 Tax=Mycena belliarum TaxID=1033014 RepID=A0AAD6U973_9AGAR|nr:DNA polymerase lambda [Mycena belliae]
MFVESSMRLLSSIPIPPSPERKLTATPPASKRKRLDVDPQMQLPPRKSPRRRSPTPTLPRFSIPQLPAANLPTRKHIDLQMPPESTRKSPPRRPPSPKLLRASIPQLSPNHKAQAILKRKESPTKPEKPARKKASMDASSGASSPIEVSPEPMKRPLPSKLTKKATRPTVKIPRAQVPETIDISMSPIEEPDFSVLVSRFEPEATSTQPPKVVAAPSMNFAEVKERVEREKQRKALKLRAKASAGPSKAGPNNRSSGDESSIISVSSSPSRASSPPLNAIVPIKASTKAKPKPKPAEKAKPVPAKKGKKNEKILMHPKDYAQMLNDQLITPDPAAKPRREREQSLKGKNIFFTGGDYKTASEGTMKRMQMIVDYGGTLFPVFDPERVTQIVTTAMSPLAMVRACGLKRMKDIPAHIPVLNWDWVLAVMDNGESGPLFEYAAYPERVPEIEYPRKGPGKGKQRARPDQSADLSRISDSTKQRNIHDSEDDEPHDRAGHRGAVPASPTSPPRKVVVGVASSSHLKLDDTTANDPLAEFYEQARADRDNTFGRLGEAENDETDDEDVPKGQNAGPAPRRGFTCDNKEVQRKNGPNEFIAKKLEELMELHKAKPGPDNHWRALGYQKAVRALRNHPTKIASINQAKKLRGVAEKTALKIMEIVNTGDLQRIKWENTEDVGVRKTFQGIYGVGQSTAYKWYAAGCRTLDDLKAGVGGVELTPAQKIGIEFYDDINDRMPREEAGALFELIKPIALALDPKIEIQIMGSYRRGKADCGDIDIMITRCPDDGKTQAGILHHLLKELRKRKIITEDLALPENPFDDESIYRGLCRLPQPGSRRRRIDFLVVPYKSRGAALLYYTGDDIFNRAMRYKANKLKYSLNQKGLYEGVVRDVQDRTKKTNKGNLLASETEEEIFRILDVPYQEPHERVRG